MCTAATLAVAPTVQITRYSPTVTGTTGTAKAGVEVAVTLIRAGTTIATAPTATTNANGEWMANLPAHAPSDFTDAVNVAYTGAGAPVPASSSYSGISTLANAAVITGDGTTITIDCQDLGVECGSAVPVTVHYAGGSTTTVSATPDGAGDYSATFSSAVTANDAVTFNPTHEYEDGSNLALVLPAGLPGVGVSDHLGVAPPTCSADLVNNAVSCVDVHAGSEYAIEQSRAGSPVETKTLTAVSDGVVTDPAALTTSFASIKAGDHLALVVPEAGGNAKRTVTTLDVYALKASVVEQDAHLDPSGTTGSCEVEEFDPLTGTLCSSLGTLSENIPDHTPRFEDELSGGATTATIPSFNDTSPTDNELTSPSFIAYADVINYGGFDDASGVALTLTPLAGGAPRAFAGDANSSAGISVTGLAAGRYAAAWTVTDSNGDTSSLTTWIVVEESETGKPGPTGPTGPAGPTGSAGGSGTNGSNGAQGVPGTPGAQGSAGPAGAAGSQGVPGQSVEIECHTVTKGTGKHKTTKRVCKVTQLPAGSAITASLRRGFVVYELGHARVSGRSAELHMHALRTTPRGHYVLTMVIRTGSRAVTITHNVAI